MSQTQKTTGKVTTIIEAQALVNIASCGTSPSSWSATLTPGTGKFDNSPATGTATAAGLPTEFRLATVTAPLKVSQVK
jgi:hypothetical protein